MTDTESIPAPTSRPVYSASITTAAGDMIGVVTLDSKRTQIVIARPDGSSVTADVTPAEICMVGKMAVRADIASDLPQAKRA